jgi:hypothetical protein
MKNKLLVLLSLCAISSLYAKNYLKGKNNTKGKVTITITDSDGSKRISSVNASADFSLAAECFKGIQVEADTGSLKKQKVMLKKATETCGDIKNVDISDSNGKLAVKAPGLQVAPAA